MKFKALTSRFATLVCGALLAASAHADLVTNGGFETGDFTGWSVVNSGTLSVVNNFPHTGSYYARFASLGAMETISQTLTTIAGANYTVSFWLRNDGGGPNEFEFNWDGGSLEEDLVNASSFGYTQYSYTLQASGAFTTISFSAFQNPSFYRLDDISVNYLSGGSELPEPGSFALLGIGLAGLAAIRKRKQA